MTEKRNTTKEDTLLKMRLLAEGVRYEVKGPLQWESTDKFVDVTFIFDDCDVVAETRANPRSCLTISLDGNDVLTGSGGIESTHRRVLGPQAPEGGL